MLQAVDSRGDETNVWTWGRIHFSVGGVKPTAAPSLSGEQQVVLEQVIVRLIHPEERPRFDQRLITGHYLHSADLVGEQLRYVAEVNGQWVALLAWSAPAFALKDREIWIAWSAAQKCRRLSLLANNSRFLVLPEHSVPNLASRVMKLCLKRLAADWQACAFTEVCASIAAIKRTQERTVSVVSNTRSLSSCKSRL